MDKSKESVNHVTTKFCIDDIFMQIGEFGKYQCLIFCLVGLLTTMSAFGAYESVFTDALPEFRCKLPMLENDTYEIFSSEQQRLVDLYIPPGKGHVTYDGCHLYNTTTHNRSETECNQWVYSKKYYDQTIVTEWNLVCDNVTLKGYFKSIFFAGTFAVIIIGMLADRYGRKRTAYIFIVLNALTFLSMSLSVNFLQDASWKQIMFGVSRFGIGATSNVYAIAAVIAVEIVGPSYRVFANNIMYYFFILGELIVLLVAYFERDYRVFSNFMTVLVSALILYFWMVPESVRYLVAKKRYQEADEIFKRIARSNNKVYSFKSEDLDNEQSRDDTKPKEISYKMLLCNWKVVTRMLVSLLQWFANSLVYYGISLNTDVLGGDPYLNFLYFTLTELFAVLCSQLILERYGRKVPYLINFLLISVSLIAIGFVPASMKWLVIVLVLISKYAISFNFNAIYIITGESYPTIIRNTALSTCSMVSRIASTLSPMVAVLGETYWKPLPFLIYGGVAALSGISFFFVMPETKDLNLPESLEDIYESES